MKRLWNWVLRIAARRAATPGMIAFYEVVRLARTDKQAAREHTVTLLSDSKSATPETQKYVGELLTLWDAEDAGFPPDAEETLTSQREAFCRERFEYFMAADRFEEAFAVSIAALGATSLLSFDSHNALSRLASAAMAQGKRVVATDAFGLILSV